MTLATVMEVQPIGSHFKKWGVSLLLFFLVLANGCARLGLGQSRTLFYRGELEEAEAGLETVRKASGKNRVLFLMERGLIYQANGKYEKSNHDLLEAARQLEKLEAIDVTEQAGSFLSSDWMLTYNGESFERVLLHTYSAINFLQLKDWEDALVECKKALKKLARSPFPYEQPFTNYLAGICYEIMGEYDSARIEYEKVRKACPDIPFLRYDLERVSAGRKISGKGELICFIQIGKSPIKVPIEFFIPPDKRFVIPEYHTRDYPSREAVVLINPASLQDVSRGETAASSESYLMTDVEALAYGILKERMAKEITREIARLAAKERVSREVEKQSSELVGNLARIGFMLAESADTRSWQTLPGKLGVARLPLDSGTYDVKIQFLDANNVLVKEAFFEQVKIEQGKTTFLLSRSVL